MGRVDISARVTVGRYLKYAAMTMEYLKNIKTGKAAEADLPEMLFDNKRKSGAIAPKTVRI